MAVADDQLALAAPDRYGGIDDLDAGLQRLRHRLAVDDTWSLALHRRGLTRRHLTLAIQGLTEWIDDTAEQAFTHWHLDDASGALHLVTLADEGVGAEQHTTDVVLFQVQGHPHDAVGKFNQFGGAHV